MARIDLSENEYLEKFVGQDHIDSNDVQFWYQLLSCSFNFMLVQDPKVVDKMLDPYLVRLTLNNSESLNIGSLVRVALDRVARVKPQNSQSTNPYYTFQSFNALYLMRCICKSYIENLSEEKLIQSFRARLDVPTPRQDGQAPPPPPPNNQTLQPVPPMPMHPQVAPQPVHSEGLESVNIGAPPVYAIQTNTTIESQQSSQQPMQNPQQPTASQPADISSGKEVKRFEITSGASMLEQYISTLIAIIVDIPQTDSTYMLQVEAINNLLVLLSIQMYSSAPASQSLIYRSLMQKKSSIHALILTKTLLGNFIRQQPTPQENGSIIIGLASGLWRVLTLGYGVSEEETTDTMPLLAKQSLMLLNILTNHYTTEKNPYREAIISCQDSKFSLTDPQTAIHSANNDALATAMTSKSALISNSIKIEFNELYATICRHLHNDQVALLLYILLHSNKIFRPYILTVASSDLNNLVLPLLKILYTSIEKGSHHVYMVLIIFIILSEESSFNEVIHRIPVRGVPWYKDRVISDISLGSLTTLIIIRSFQFNTFRVRDKFLHTNLFATLANLSNHFHHLHPYVCQRLIDLLERLTKRYLLITKPGQPKLLAQASASSNPKLEVLTSDSRLARALATDTSRQDLHDVSSIELDSTPVFAGEIATSQSGAAPQNESSINISIPSQQQVQSSQATNGSNNNNNIVLPPVDIHGNEYTNIGNVGQPSPSSNSSVDHINISMDDSKQDISLIEEVIRMILEVINNSLASKFERNPDLIYTLLYKRHIFGCLMSSHQSFYNMVINVERILTFFYNKIESFQRSLSVDEIKDLIRDTSKEWNYNLVPEKGGGSGSNHLLFHYVEDEQPEEFFIPYIWTRIYYSSGILWNPKRIVLFNLEDL